MKVVKPLSIDPSNIVSSTVPAGHDMWTSAAIYSKGDLVEYSGRTFESLEASNQGNIPGAVSGSLKWVDVGPSNGLAMFDSQVSTQSIQNTSMTVVVQPLRFFNSLCIVNMRALEAVVTINDGIDGPVIYQRSFSDTSNITNWYQYFYEPYSYITEIILTDIPPYANGVITVHLTGDSNAIGYMGIGTAYEIGEASIGASVSIEDYSKVITDEFGDTQLIRRNSTKRTRQQVLIQRSNQAAIFRLIDGLRATPCVWIPSELEEDSVLTTFGVYSNFSLVVEYPNHCMYDLEIKGMT